MFHLQLAPGRDFAHVRSGAQYAPGAISASLQPPLNYFLQAWNASGLPDLLVVAEDEASPVVQTLHMMGGVLQMLPRPRARSVILHEGGFAALCLTPKALPRFTWRHQRSR